MQAEWTDPISLLKGELRPYRGYREGFRDVWNTKESSIFFWAIPTLAYDEFKLDRMAPEMIIYREDTLYKKKKTCGCATTHPEGEHTKTE